MNEIKVIDFEFEHLDKINIQKAQKKAIEDIDSVKKYIDKNTSLTIVNYDKILLVGGLIQKWQNVYIAFSYFSEEASSYMLTITRLVKKYFSLFNNIPRIECYVAPSFKNGNQFAKLIGFEFECLSRKPLADDQNYNVYVRIS